MAQNETVKVDLVQVNTNKVEKSTNTLKGRIRELKLALEQMDATSKQYKDTLIELGNTQHQLSEIQNQAKLATEDYGQTLSNITSIAAGAVASFSAINGVMNLMGASSSEAQEAMVKIQSLMAIVQGLSALDTAEKNFQGLWTKIKNLTVARTEETIADKKETEQTNKNTVANAANTTSINAQTKATGKLKIGLATLGVGFKNLGRAMKAFAMSNPFTLIITAITTAIELISHFIDKARQATEAARKAAVEAKKAQLEEDVRFVEYMGSTTLTEDDYKRRGESYRKSHQSSLNYSQTSVDNARSKMLSLDDDKKYTEEGKKIYEVYYYTLENYYLSYINKVEKENKQHNANLVNYEDELKDARGSRKRELQGLIKTEKELVNTTDENVKKGKIELGKALYGMEEYTKAYDAKQKADSAKRAADFAAARKNAQTKELKDLNDKLSQEEKLNDNAYERQEKSQAEYLQKNIDLLKGYYEDVKKLKAKGNPEVDDKMLTDIEGTILSAQKKLAEYEVKLIETRKIFDSDVADITITVDESKYAKQNTEALMNNIKEQQEKTKALETDSWLARYQRLQKQNEEEIELERVKNENLFKLNMERLKDEEDVANLNYAKNTGVEVETYQKDLDVYKAQLEKKLISKEEYDRLMEEAESKHTLNMAVIQTEYDNQLIDFEQRRTELEAEYAEQRYNIAKDEIARKIELQETYFNAYQSIMSGVSGFLSEIQNNYDENSKEYKAIAVTNAITDTISGTLSAFMSGVKSGVPAPWNLAVASAMAATTFATGVAQIANLQKGTLTNSAQNANLDTNKYETLSYETMSDLSGNIGDSKVYIVESEMTSVQRRVDVTEQEASF